MRREGRAPTLLVVIEYCQHRLKCWSEDPPIMTRTGHKPVREKGPLPLLIETSSVLRHTTHTPPELLTKICFLMLILQ